MVNLKRLFKPYKDMPAFSDYIDIVEFIDDNVFFTKSLQLGVILSVKGIDYESVITSQLDSLTSRLERAFRLFDSRYRVYQYFFRQSHPVIPAREYTPGSVASVIVGSRLQAMREQSDELYQTSNYIAILLDLPDQGKAKLSERMKAKTVISTRLLQLETTRRTLMQQVSTFVSTVADYAKVSLLPAEDAYRVLRALLNPDPLKRLAGMPEDGAAHPAYYATGSTLRAYPNHLELDQYRVRLLTLKGFPTNSGPNLLKNFFLVPGNYHIVSTWRPENQQQTITHAKGIIGYNEATKKDAVSSYLNKGQVRTDRSKDVQSDDLDAVMVDISRNDRTFGFYSFTIVVYALTDAELDELTADFLQAAQRAGIELFTESNGANLAFLATTPGAFRYEKRTKRISDANFADLSFFYTLDTGNQRNRFLNDEYLALFTTRNKTPFFFNLHSGEVAHTLILGPSGMGKSFLANYLISQATKYEPCISIIDLGGSYKYLMDLLGGNYTNISSTDQNLYFNPFVLPKSQENIEFLSTLVTSLMEQSGRALDDSEKQAIYEKIRDLYALENPHHRRLGVLANTLPENLRLRLTRWVNGGQYGYIFDNEAGEDRLIIGKIQAFNFEGFEPNADFLEPLLFYILKRSAAVIADDAYLDTFKLFLLDEAWTFFRNQSIKTFFMNGIKTWRKRNAAFLFATQAVNDLNATQLLEDVVTNCPTKLFLANPSLDRQTFVDTFKMPPDAAELIATLVPRKEILLLQEADPQEGGGNGRIAKVMRLEVSRRERWIYSNSAKENVIRAKALEQFDGDLNKALDYLVTLPN